MAGGANIIGNNTGARTKEPIWLPRLQIAGTNADAHVAGGRRRNLTGQKIVGGLAQDRRLMAWSQVYARIAEGANGWRRKCNGRMPGGRCEASVLIRTNGRDLSSANLQAEDSVPTGGARKARLESRAHRTS